LLGRHNSQNITPFNWGIQNFRGDTNSRIKINY